MFGELQDGGRYLNLKVTAVGVQKNYWLVLLKKFAFLPEISVRYLFKKSVKTFQDSPDFFNVYN